MAIPLSLGLVEHFRRNWAKPIRRPEVDGGRPTVKLRGPDPSEHPVETRQLILVPQISSVPAITPWQAACCAGWSARTWSKPCPVPSLAAATAWSTPSRRGPQGRRTPRACAPGPAAHRPGDRRQALHLYPARGFLGEAGCPDCRREIGEPLFESLENWWPGETDNFTCPECGFEDDINGFLFLQPCGFSNLAFIFNGCTEAGFDRAFLAAFADRLGYPVRVVRVED